MGLYRPTQNEFKIRVYSPGSKPASDDNFISRGEKKLLDNNGEYIDVESFVGGDVIYEEQASLLNVLTFTIDKDADVLIQRMIWGQWVVLYGGFYTDEGSSLRKVFSGTIVRIRTELPNNGRAKFTVTAYSYGYTQMGKEPKYITYPDPDSSRNFLKGKDSIQLREVIEGISKEDGVEIGAIILPKKVANKSFTLESAKHQKGVTDWAFLNELATQHGCTLWISYEDGVEKLYFIDTEKASRSYNEEINFLYPLQGTYGVKDIRDEEMHSQRYLEYNRPRLIWDVTIDEDISMAASVSRSAMYFNKETGEYTEAIAEITEQDGKRVVRFYELDESRIQYIHENRPDIAEKIRNSDPTSLEWSSGVKNPEDESPNFARYYYRIKEVYDEEMAVFDRALMGITVTATCAQDLRIRSQQVYNVRGILRYTSKTSEGKYLLMGLKHIWGSQGPITELEFRK
jgi:hypothetical protein